MQVFGFILKRLRGKKRCFKMFGVQTSMGWVSDGWTWEGASSQMQGLYQNKGQGKVNGP
jgi:hypothetical protein